MLRLLEEGKISKDALKDIVACVADEKLEALEAAKKLNLLLLTRKEVENIIKEIIEENSSLVAERGMGAMGPLMGQAMKKLRGKADGQLVNKILKKMLKEKI